MDSRRRSGKQNIFHAITRGKVRLITNLLNDNPNVIHERDYNNKTPLIHAVCDAREEIRTHLVRMLIRSGSDINAQDDQGRTALMYAMMDFEKLDLVRIMGRCKELDANIQDSSGYTLFMHGIMCANSSGIRLILNSTKSSIDLELRNAQDLTALELAVKLQMSECCKVLVCEGGANTKQVKNQVGLLRLLEDENLLFRSNTPHSRNPSRSAFMNNFRKLDSPIMENRNMEGSYMSRDTTPNIGDDYSERVTPMQPVSRSNSLYRTNSNLYKRRPEAGPKPTSNDVIGPLISPRNSLKRVLTPISSRNSPARQLEIAEESPNLGNRTRLPSIPSGRKLYLVSSPSPFQGYTKTPELL